MKTIRAFIAIELPEEVKRMLWKVSETLAAQMPDRAVRWVKPDRMHLTLRFLGDTAVSQLSSIAGQLDRVSAQHATHTLETEGLGCFPNRKRPRVIWVGLQGELEATGRLKQAIDQALVPLGWKEEDRPFRPHLTLGRVKDSRKLQGVHWEAEVGVAPVPVTAVHLIESTLRPDGPIYTVRHTSRLAGIRQDSQD